MIKELLNNLENVEEFINNFDFNNRASVIVFLVVAIEMYISMNIAVNTSSIEEVFMKGKRRKRNYFFKLLSLSGIFIPANYILSIENMFIIIEVFGAVVGIIAYFIYNIKEAATKKFIELNVFYKEKRSECILFSIICTMPVIIILLNQIAKNISMFSYIIVVSVIEVLFICISVPEFINKSTDNYFLDNDNKVFIYKRLDDDIIMCGDNTEMNKSSKYITISYEELKNKEIIHIQHNRLTKKEKKELIKEYRDDKSKTKIWITQGGNNTSLK